MVSIDKYPQSSSHRLLILIKAGWRKQLHRAAIEKEYWPYPMFWLALYSQSVSGFGTAKFIKFSELFISGTSSGI
jgi:hypothetical protein